MKCRIILLAVLYCVKQCGILEEITILEKTNSLSVNMNIMTLSYKDTFEKLKKLVPHPVRDEKESC